MIIINYFYFYINYNNIYNYINYYYNCNYIIIKKWDTIYMMMLWEKVKRKWGDKLCRCFGWIQWWLFYLQEINISQRPLIFPKSNQTAKQRLIGTSQWRRSGSEWSNWMVQISNNCRIFNSNCSCMLLIRAEWER